MTKMEQDHGTLPPPQIIVLDSTSESTTKPMASQMPETGQHPKTPSPRQTPEVITTPRSTPKSKASTNRADWVNAFWADISGQLRRFAVISPDLFDGLSLRRDTFTGLLILRELRKIYQELGDDRSLATVTVVLPQDPVGRLWQLYWTIKRPRDPNGRQFHSEATIDPINNQSHLQIEPNPGGIYSKTHFLLPPFIQDFGPGPLEFDREPDETADFDAVVTGIKTDADTGTWVDWEPEADGAGGGGSDAKVNGARD